MVKTFAMPKQRLYSATAPSPGYNHAVDSRPKHFLGGTGYAELERERAHTRASREGRLDPGAACRGGICDASDGGQLGARGNLAGYSELGGDADELAREAANDRRVLMRSFIMEWVNILVIICVGLARSALRELGMSWSAYQGYSMVLGVIQWTVMLYMLFAVAGRDRVRRARDLVNATDIVAFLEGRASADELPRDWFYRWVLTKVNWWRWGIVAVLLVCFLAMGMGATRSIA